MFCRFCGKEIPDGSSCGCPESQKYSAMRTREPGVTDSVRGQKREDLQTAPPRRQPGVSEHQAPPRRQPVAAGRQAPPHQQSLSTVQRQQSGEKSNKGLVIGIIIAAVVAVCVLTVLVILLVSGNSSKKPEVHREPDAIETQETVLQSSETEPDTMAQSEETEPVKETETANALVETETERMIEIGGGQTPAENPSTVITPGTGYALSNDYVIADSDRRYLSSSEISGMSLRDLNYARNEIYARHHYIFKSSELQNYFSSKSWYSGKYTIDQFDNAVFNDYEWKNITLLRDREYALNANGYVLDR